MKTTHLLIALALLATLPCMAQRKAAYAYTNHTVECLGVELDGSQTLRISGIGRNRQDAKEQVKKNAVYFVLFQGITAGQQGCNQRPVLAEANAFEKYEDYFNLFFADGGDYKEYISMEDTKRRSSVKAKSKATANYTITVRVLRPQLKARMKADGLLKTE